MTSVSSKASILKTLIPSLKELKKWTFESPRLFERSYESQQLHLGMISVPSLMMSLK